MEEKMLREAIQKARRPREIEAAGKKWLMYDISGIPGATSLPRALVSLLENVVRNAPSDEDAERAARSVIEAAHAGEAGSEIEFMPARVLFQDFTGVPVFVDFACMRDEVVERGGDPSLVNPHIPCTLVIDHSVVADCVGSADAAECNRQIEAARNRERFAFLKWASQSFDNVEIVPPGGGICHQLNIERFCKVVATDALSHEDLPVACFDTLVGTDSHTTTANGIGVLGWGVGGIEAEAAALGQPITMLVPSVVELRLTGSLPEGVQGMDLALSVAKLLREEGVVGCIVEVTGPGVASLTATQRACVANMTPEYGATSTLFPVDDVVLDYLQLTGRKQDDVALVETYLKAQGTFGVSDGRTYARTVELDLSTLTPCLAGPSRPHDQVTPAALQERVRATSEAHGHTLGDVFDVECAGEHVRLGHGTIAIAAVTSCTTATDPAMMVAAGLVAQKASARGLTPKPWVKRILAPGSRSSELLLERADLIEPLRQIGFYICGFGCMSCIGNSGEILDCLKPHAQELELTSVLSGNRNFDGRISPDVSQNYLCTPAMVIAYSLAGTMDIDLTTEPIATAPDGSCVMLSDIMPSSSEVEEVLSSVLTRDLFDEGAANLFEGGAEWSEIDAGESTTFGWDLASTYVRKPPYFEIARPCDEFCLSKAKALVKLGDFVTTDHISPAGKIAAGSPAARYLEAQGVAPADFNSYGSRRGNHEVMMRGTFANVKLENSLAAGRKGGWTLDQLDGQIKSIYDAAVDYTEHGVDLVALAGKLYGSGSSRDWAGKGPALLGIRAVIAETFERIHRSNLIGMGIVPLEYCDGQTAESLGLDGSETFDIDPVDVSGGLPASRTTSVRAERSDGTLIEFECTVRIDTPTEGYYIQAGGILPFVLGSLVRN